jgi:plastocyanin
MTHPQIVPNTQGSSPDSWYEPDPIRVRVGQTITWTNQDTDPHDVTADDGTFASGPIGAGGSFRWTPTRPGTYRYICTLHPEMHGEIIVRA